MKGLRVHHNPSLNFLIKKTLKGKEAVSSQSGALAIYTGKYTGRSPLDRFIVDTKKVHDKINWGKINIAIKPENYEKLNKKITAFFDNQKEYYIVDAWVGADRKYSLPVRFFCEFAHEALFVNQLFRPAGEKNFVPQLTVYCAPSVSADPKKDGTYSEAFVILNFDKKRILIGTTRYGGEIKKSVFSYMNYLLPQEKVLPMHCSANIEADGRTTALFFGLSGTGKTTLSADPKRRLIGDDEHGWSPRGIFNFENGCYAKCIRIKKESEPQIWSAIHRRGTLVENVVMDKNGKFDFDDAKYTENTRAAYPLKYIRNSVADGRGKHPKYILFLTADATGVLPPVAHLTLNQAAYHFVSGYTSKLAGTERGITHPKATFSAFFGAPFMPLKPMVYLNLLKNYLKKHETRVYLVNTGWIGGEYGIGHRIPIKETRNIVTAILTGKLDRADYRHDPVFNLYVPKDVPGVDPMILDPALSWKDKKEYNKNAIQLASLFIENMKKYLGVYQSIINAGPKI